MCSYYVMFSLGIDSETQKWTFSDAPKPIVPKPYTEEARAATTNSHGSSCDILNFEEITTIFNIC